MSRGVMLNMPFDLLGRSFRDKYSERDYFRPYE